MLQSLKLCVGGGARAPVAMPCRSLTTTAAIPAKGLRSIKPTTFEKLSGELSKRNMQSALEALHHDGVVVVEDVIEHDAIDSLNERMCRDTRVLIGRGEQGPFNYNLGNLQQCPPFEQRNFHPSIFFNPLASNVTAAFLGGKPTMSFVSSNAAVKADLGQPVHCDADFDHPTIPFAAVVNVGLVDMLPSNGSTEIWPGSHRDTTVADQEGAHGERASGRIRVSRLEARKTVSPPLQPTVKKGSLIIRDLRLWHAGMPNRTDEIRIMLAMIHFAPWYRQRMTLDLPQELRPVLLGSHADRLNIPVRFSAQPIDHLNAGFGNSFDFDQDL